jgi:hypothetical protein
MAYNLKQILGGSSHGNTRAYLNHYKRLQNFLDAYETRKASVEFRHNVLRKQKKHNYQLEYDRIRGALHDNLVPNTTKNMIKDRMKHLEELGAKAVNKIKD